MVASTLTFVRQKWFVAAGLCFLVFMGIVFIKQWSQKREVQKEVDALRTQAEQQTQKNQELQSFIAYLNTDEYKQKAAREQLNLKKDGEFVYSFSQDAAAQAGDQQQATTQGSEQSNPHKWWNYFFHPSS